MSMISWPFDSTLSEDAYGNPVYSRAYSSDVLARILRKYFNNGVFATPEDCLRVLEASGMNVSVNPGDCLIEGRHGYLEAAETLAVAAADPALSRIDLVVLRLDLSVSGLSVTPAVVTGTAAASPAAPTVTRNSTVYELALAQLYIGAGVTSIPQSVITDTRLDSDRCGVVASILGDTDTSTYYAQIAADLAEFKAGREAAFDAWYAAQTADFNTWFASIMEALDDNIVTNLYSLIDQYKAKKTTVTLAVADWTGSGPYTQTKSISIVPAHCVLHAGPAEASRDDYASSDVHVSSASEGSVTFTAEVLPDGALTVNIAISEVDA
jgi:hypothetical protein